MSMLFLLGGGGGGKGCQKWYREDWTDTQIHRIHMAEEQRQQTIPAVGPPRLTSQ